MEMLIKKFLVLGLRLLGVMLVLTGFLFLISVFIEKALIFEYVLVGSFSIILGVLLISTKKGKFFSGKTKLPVFLEKINNNKWD